MSRHLSLYNTLTREVEQFNPLQEGAVSIYTCGPTVYNHQHIGNYRTFIFEDILVKTLLRFGYQVNRVMNITDVGHLTSDEDEGEDKLQVGAVREGLSAWEVAKKYEAAFFADAEKLQLLQPTGVVRATDTIQEQINFIKELEERGLTYQTEDGLYFDSSKLPDYGKLARLDIAGLQAGARVDMQGKRHPTDFALWKFSKVPGERHMEWESPWGLGFPGWHIECSAIIRQSLGDSIDIHCGGVDHIPVHHTNEIAQSESVTGQPLAQYWSHGDFLLVDGGKMGKSLGNVYTLADLEAKGCDPLAFRLFTYSASYRSKLNFTWEGLEVAQHSLEKLRATYQEAGEGRSTERTGAYKEKFDLALADDLNLPVAMAVVWEVVKSDLTSEEKHAFLQDADAVLSLDLAKPTSFIIPEEIQVLADRRQQARANQNWNEADALRQQIEAGGFEVLDTPTGSAIKKK